jgi:hypothetical protein
MAMGEVGAVVVVPRWCGMGCKGASAGAGGRLEGTPGEGSNSGNWGPGT